MSMSKKQYLKRKSIMTNNRESYERFARLKKWWADEDVRVETITLVIALIIIAGAGIVEKHLDNKKSKTNIQIKYTEKKSQIINYRDSLGHTK